jgi:hypothetical protein
MKTSQQFAISFCVAASLCVALCLPVFAQHQTNAKSTSKEDARSNDVTEKLQEAAKKGFALTAKTNVSQSASIQAVLIPANLAQRIFGKEVAHNYAVVELIVSNEDEKAALVVHSVFLDYSQWALSGFSQTAAGPAGPTSQVFTKSAQVASIESRLIRGEMLDAQQWTLRNWTVRSLTAVGSIAGGFAFPFSGDVAKGIAAFNGEVVPGAAALWPDGTVNQINRVTDFGFQTNKVIPKQAADVLVAFFPIERFLTPGFKKVFLKDPAALFVPYQMMSDPETVRDFQNFVQPWVKTFSVSCNANCNTKAKTDDSESPAAGTEADFAGTMRRAIFEEGCPADMETGSDTSEAKKAGAEESATEKSVAADISATVNDQAALNHANLCKLKRILQGVSLNNIRVGLEGAMTVDVNTVPATIYDVQFDSGNTDSSIWTKTGTEQKGTISGVYLTGGQPEVVDSKGTKYSDITISKDAKEDSSDTELHFTMKITKCIPPSSKIYFVVNKSPNQNETDKAAKSTKKSGAKSTTSKSSNSNVASTPYEFPLPAYECPASANEGATGDGAKGDQDEIKEKDKPAESKTRAAASPAPSTNTPKDNKGDELPKKK